MTFPLICPLVIAFIQPWEIIKGDIIKQIIKRKEIRVIIHPALS
jgi:hypothetical protein